MSEASGVYQSSSSTLDVPTLSFTTSMFVVFWEDVGAFHDESSSRLRTGFEGMLMSDDAAPIQMSELDRDAMVLQDLFYSIKARRCLWPGVYDLHMSPEGSRELQLTDWSTAGLI
jgi:hypothetical protein